MTLLTVLEGSKSGADVFEAWQGEGCPSNVEWRRLVKQGRLLGRRSAGAKSELWHCLVGTDSVEQLLGTGVWKPKEREPVWKATIMLQAGNLRQLVKWDVLLCCSDKL